MVLKPGKFLGHGCFKTCYAYGRHQVVIVGESTDDTVWEVDALTRLDEAGWPTPTVKIIDVLTEHGPETGMLQSRLYDYFNYQKTLDGLSMFKMLFRLSALHIDDLQWMTDRAGNLVVHDPMALYECDCHGICSELADMDLYLESLELYKNTHRRSKKSQSDFRKFHWKRLEQ